MHATSAKRIRVAITSAFALVFIAANALLEYLEMLNAYNCERWACSMVPIGSGVFLGLIYGLMACTGHGSGAVIEGLPAVLALLFTGLTLMRWDIDPIDVSVGLDHDRHRAEYYDTHNFVLVIYMGMMVYYTIVVFWYKDPYSRSYQHL